MSARAVGLLMGLFVAGCAEAPRRQGPVASAEFGIFFGGQVQERDELPFNLDRARQSQGFRLQFHAPLAEPLPVAWELDMPGAGRRREGRVTKTGQAAARAGLSRLDQELPFEPGDPLGTWNVRVLVDGAPVIDRPFVVYDPAARRRARREAEAKRAKAR